MRPDDVGLGGFDSHTLPPARGRGRSLAVTLAMVFVLSAMRPLVAQQPPVPPPPTAAKPAAAAPARDSSARDKPPISPGRAFLYSALIPGLGQAALNRKYTGAAFFFVEAFSLSLLHRSADDLRLAKAFVGDSVPLRYDVDPTTGIARRDGKGDPIVAQWQPSGYTPALVRARKLQVEDWVAVVIFNHLISGADAFVAANLWDLPQHVSMRAFPVRGGAGLVFGAAFR